MTRFPPNVVKTALLGKQTEDGGLQLRITRVDDSGQRHGSWYFRYSFEGKQQEIGLGSIKRVTLKQARAERDRYADLMADRFNPINPKDAKRTAQQAQVATPPPTLAQVAQLAFEARQGELRGDGKAGRWMSPLEQHVFPRLGNRPIDQVDRDAIKAALAPIWKAKAPTAKKAINRLGIVFRHARAMGLSVDPMVVEDAKQLLGAQGHAVRNHPALPAQETPRLYQSLELENVTQRALAFYLLTGGGTRIKPLLTMRFDQVDGDVWTIPGEAMKGRRGRESDFRVPLTPDLLRLIEISRNQNEDGTLVFRSPNANSKGERAVTDQAVENVMRRSEKVFAWSMPYRPHGLRATFRTWVSNTNPALYAVAETALAHKVGNIVERTYDRNDFLEERRALLEAWGGFLKGC